METEPWLTDPKVPQFPPFPLTRLLGSIATGASTRLPAQNRTRSPAGSASAFSRFDTGKGQKRGRAEGPDDDDETESPEDEAVGRESDSQLTARRSSGTQAALVGRDAASQAPLSLVKAEDDASRASRTTTEGPLASPAFAFGFAAGSADQGSSCYESIRGTDLERLLPHVSNVRERLRFFVQRYDPGRLGQVNGMWDREGKEAWRAYFDRFQVRAHK